jgi:opacity protein-like surface antigen
MMTSIRTGSVALVIVFAVVIALSAASPASADDCAALGGALVGTECQLSAAVTRSGTFTLDHTLHILGTGKITVPPAPGGNDLTLDITGGLIMDVPTLAGRSQIVGDVTTAGGIGATITVLASGDILLHGNGSTGARISSNQVAGSCSGGRGGNITLTAEGLVDTQAGSTITSIANCNGGEIIITADLSIDIDGLVQSESTAARSPSRPAVTSRSVTPGKSSAAVWTKALISFTWRAAVASPSSAWWRPPVRVM